MTSDRAGLRVAIDISVMPGVDGGIVQSTQGLVRSLGQLDGLEQYVLVATTPAEQEWVRQYIGPNQEIVVLSELRERRSYRPNDGAVKRLVRPTLEAVRGLTGRITPRPRWREVPVSDGFYEGLGCSVMHFPTQTFTLCSLPTIYNPHDLQHLHLPQFFTPDELARREMIYRTACQLSNTIVVGSAWIKQDVIRQYAVSGDKVQIIPWAPPTAHYPAISNQQLADARRRFSLPTAFAFYPAVTWPHKNHLRLFDALAALRDRGLVIHLVCTGAKYERHWPQIQRRLGELHLESQVTFLGFVSEVDLRAVYRLAQFLVLPTLFEADSCPIHEAWSEGLPVASSNLTALPEQVGDAGLLFDATSVSAIADALRVMTDDAALRARLVERGYRRVKDFDWSRTASAFRAVYRRAAGLTLSDEDRWLLQWDWMNEPERGQTLDGEHEH